jgi:hypothetical protein
MMRTKAIFIGSIFPRTLGIRGAGNRQYDPVVVAPPKPALRFFHHSIRDGYSSIRAQAAFDLESGFPSARWTFLNPEVICLLAG